MRPTSASGRLVLVLAVTLGCAACGGRPSAGPDLTAPTGTSGPGGEPTSSAAPEPPAPGGGGGTGAAAAPSGTRECKAADLTLALTPGSGAGMSHVGMNLRFTNRSGSTCQLQGSPGVSFVAGDDGHQVGGAASRSPKSQGKIVVLRPNAGIDAPLRITDYEAYEAADCRPVAARGLRVYAPDDTAAMFVPYETTTCSAPDKVLLQVDVLGGG